MTPARLDELLGMPPIPRGTWAREAVYLSPAAARDGRDPEATAGRLRALPGIADVRVRPGGFLEIVVTVPGELVTEIAPAAPATAGPAAPVTAGPAAPATAATGASATSTPAPVAGVSPWADLPRTWANPGFVVRYAHVRAVAVQRWAAELGVGGRFEPELLDGPLDRAVLRVLAEAHGRRTSRDPGWAAYAVRLALAYHDAFEGAGALPVGDEDPSPLHAARVRLGRAVRDVLAEALAAVGERAPDRM